MDISYKILYDLNRHHLHHQKMLCFFPMFWTCSKDFELHQPPTSKGSDGRLPQVDPGLSRYCQAMASDWCSERLFCFVFWIWTRHWMSLIVDVVGRILSTHHCQQLVREMSIQQAFAAAVENFRGASWELGWSIYFAGFECHYSRDSGRNLYDMEKSWIANRLDWWFVNVWSFMLGLGYYFSSVAKHMIQVLQHCFFISWNPQLLPLHKETPRGERDRGASGHGTEDSKCLIACHWSIFKCV